MEVFKSEVESRLCAISKISETDCEYKISFKKGGKLVIPKALSRKMVSKDTGFHSEKEVINAIILTTTDYQARIQKDFVTEEVEPYSIWLKKVSRNKCCIYKTKMTVDVIPKLHKVTFMSVKNQCSFIMDC